MTEGKGPLTINGHHDRNVGPDQNHFTDTTPLLADVSVSPSWRRWLVGPAVFLFMAGYITAYATAVQYMYARVKEENFPNVTFNSSVSLCEVNTSDPDYQLQVKSQEQASDWLMYFSLFGGIPAVFSNAILGCYTDRFGRKFLFLLPCVGTFIRIAVTAIGVYTSFPLIYFCIGYFIEGLTGGMFTLFLASFTYIADCTPPGKTRSFGIVLIELAIGAGISGFSFVSGYFIQDTGFFYPMATSLALVTASFITSLFLQESYSKEKRRIQTSKFVNLTDGFTLFFGASNKGVRWILNVAMLVFFLSMFPVFGRSGVEPLYQMDSPFCWGPEKLGWFGALRSGIQQVVGMGLVKVVQKFMSDEAIALTGCLSFAGAFAIEGLAKNGTMIYLGKYKA